MKTPFVEEEFETIRHIKRTGASIARFGDGELRNALGGSCKCQNGHHELAKRLREVLNNNTPNLMVGIPRSHGRADLWRSDPKKAEAWERYERQKFLDLYDSSKRYFSSFITRPDSAPHIDCDQYWELVKSIWSGREVYVATGGKWKNNQPLFDNASSVEYDNDFPAQHAFFEHERILNKLSKVPRNKIILLSLGPEATVLAKDLSDIGKQALDLGHLEMFYRRGRFKKEDVFSKNDLQQERDLGEEWKNIVRYLIESWKCRSVLDYGCGSGNLILSIANNIPFLICQFFEYDPGIKGKTKCPESPLDLVVCSNVLHTIGDDRIDNVLDHINFLASKLCLFIINGNGNDKDFWMDKILNNRKWRSVEYFPTNIKGFFAIIGVKR